MLLIFVPLKIRRCGFSIEFFAACRACEWLVGGICHWKHGLRGEWVSLGRLVVVVEVAKVRRILQFFFMERNVRILTSSIYLVNSIHICLVENQRAY